MEGQAGRGNEGQRWAVTGATGLLGNNLVRALRGRGATVSVLARSDNPGELLGVDVRVVRGDLGDADALKRCFEGADFVVHAAAMVWIGYSRRAEMEAVNVEGTRAVCAAVPSGARLLHVSSVDALGYGTLSDPADEDRPPLQSEAGVPYVDTKRAADRVVREVSPDHVLLHPTLMFGPWDWKPSSGKMLLAVARGEGRFPPSGANNVVHVSDVCEGILSAARAPHGRAFILGNENLTYFDIWTIIAEITGGGRPLATLPAWLGGVATGAIGVLDRLRKEEGELNAAATRMGFVSHCFTPARARAELGLPATPVREAIADAWRWFLETEASALPATLRARRRPEGTVARMP